MKVFIRIIILLALFTACDGKKQQASEQGIKYTCSMHPQVVKDKPGNCPICHMQLIPVQKAVTNATVAESKPMDTSQTMMNTTGVMNMPNGIGLSDEQVRLGNIQTDTIGRNGFGNALVLTGTVAFNEGNIETISARIKGRIEKLYYKNNGDYVPRGAKLYDLYSEELNTAKQEYILLLQKSGSAGSNVIDYKQLVEAARHKLLLWGMSSAQIAVLGSSGKTPYATSFYSPAGGYITQLNVTEGGYVSEGQSITRLANTSSVWVEAQAYASQLPNINTRASVKVTIPAVNKTVTGSIGFASPEINTQTRISLLRVNITDASNELKPGMAAYIYLENTGNNDAIALPADAIIRTSSSTYVWLKTGRNSFRMQQVTTGDENGSLVEIRQGLQPGSEVVVSGTYLLNSEYLLRNGASSMEGMKM